MSNFYNRSFKDVILKSTTTHQCYTAKTGKINIYLTSSSINNDTTYDSFSNTKYELYVS